MIATSVSVSPYESCLVVSVSAAIVVSLSLSPIILPPFLVHHALPKNLTVGLYICSHQLLDKASSMMIILGSGL